MSSLALRPVVLLSAFVLASGGVSVAAFAGPGHVDARSAPALLLPDLDQEAPSQLQVKTLRTAAGISYRLGFRSAVRNLGVGPLVVRGARPDLRSEVMQVDQVIDRARGGHAVVAGIGTMRYAASPDHSHWHYQDFERYQLQQFELRAADRGSTVATASKTGFCLGDRYRVTSRLLPAAPDSPKFVGHCGLGRPDLSQVEEGISVGFGDDYSAFLEGQDLPIDGLPDGRYVLVHRVNADHHLRETSYRNNAASLLLQLHWVGHRPQLRVVASCPDSATCAEPLTARTVTSGLDTPWDIAFLPDGAAFVTERPGRVRLLDPTGELRSTAVATVPVTTQGEGGLLGVALDPAFRQNQLVYLYYTSGDRMRLQRWRWDGANLQPQVTLVDSILAGDVHDSGRIDFGPDRLLYIATGDAGQPALSQSPTSLNGKMLTLTPEQYHGDGVAQPRILVTGLRNSQGFDWRPRTAELYANDHGPSGFDGPEGYDEVNRLVPGGNYGWPDVIGLGSKDAAYTPPVRLFVAPIAPAGAAFVTARRSPWFGSYVIASLRGERLMRLQINDGKVSAESTILDGRYGRLRTVREGPGDCLYVLTSNRDGRGSPREGDDRVLCVPIPTHGPARS